MNGQSCEKCRYWYVPQEQQNKTWGECLRYPRTVQIRDDGCDKDAWCGEFRIALPVTADETARLLAQCVLDGDLDSARGLADRLIELDSV